MTHTIISFAATTNIIKQQTLPYTDLNHHNHHLPLRDLTTTSIRVALSCKTYKGFAPVLIVSSPARLHYLPHVFRVSACLLAVNLLAYIFIPLSRVDEMRNLRTVPSLRSTLAPA
jgi:hypothetical protein